MRRGWKWLAIAVAFAGLTASEVQPSRAESPDKATQDAMQGIIARQIEAFGKDDGVTAESFAAPGIKAMFPDAKDFLAMVNRSYAPLVRPRSTHFDAAEQAGPHVIQKVTVVDAAGAAWTAIYSFETVDGALQINGCVLAKEDSTTI